MANTKVTELTETTNPATSDLVYIVTTPGGTPASKKCTISNLKTAMSAVAGPASAVNNNVAVFDGVTGKLIKDGGYPLGNYHRLSHTILGSPAASIDISNISGSYYHLMCFFEGRSSSAGSKQVLLTFNNDTGANYNRIHFGAAKSTTWDTTNALGETIGGTSMLLGYMPGSDATAGLSMDSQITIPNYAGTTFSKKVIAHNGPIFATTANNIWIYMMTGWWNSTNAINRITLTPSADNFVTGTVFTIYGMS